jgi:acetyltransferase AlgX (SGNH hydrolase-like protein)
MGRMGGMGRMGRIEKLGASEANPPVLPFLPLLPLLPFLALALWAATAWLGRQPAPWAIRLTTPAFVVSLIATYVGICSLLVARARTPRRAMLGAVAVTFSLLIGLLVLEAPAAIGIVDYSRIRGALTGRWDGPAEDFVLDHELSFKRPPHSHWSGFPRSNMAQAFNLPIRSTYRQSFSTDANGFRNPADLDRADVAMIGDSYIEGAYVSDEETAAVRLHELTGQRVANLGVSGYGPLQEFKVFEKYGLPLQPHLIAWFFFEGNDFDDDQAYENSMAYEHGAPPPKTAEARASGWQAFLNRSLTMNAVLQLRETLDPIVPNAVDSFGWFRDRTGVTRRMYFFDFYATREIGSYERERFESTETTFRKASEICQQRGIRLVVFYIPMKFRVYADSCTFPPGSPCTKWQPWKLEDEFAAFCREAGIEFVSVTDAMRKAAAAGEVVYAPEDSHWSAEGHRLVARLVRDADAKH